MLEYSEHNEKIMNVVDMEIVVYLIDKLDSSHKQSVEMIENWKYVKQGYKIVTTLYL